MKEIVNRLKLAKMLMKFGETATDKGTLTYEGELAEGLEVFIEVEGELVPAEDGEYVAEDKTIVVAEGKVSEIKPIEEPEEPKEEPKEEPEVEPTELDENEEKIKELEAKVEELNQIIADKDAYIAELEDKVKKQEETLKMSADKPAYQKIKEPVVTKEIKALKYFK